MYTTSLEHILSYTGSSKKKHAPSDVKAIVGEVTHDLVNGNKLSAQLHQQAEDSVCGEGQNYD